MIEVESWYAEDDVDAATFLVQFCRVEDALGRIDSCSLIKKKYSGAYENYCFHINACALRFPLLGARNGE